MQQTTYLIQILNVALCCKYFCRKTLKYFKAKLFVFRRLELILQFLKCLVGDMNTDYGDD